MIMTATEQEVRNHFKAKGYEVRISKDGRVQYRNPGGEWLEGRYVAEYRVMDGQVVHT